MHTPQANLWDILKGSIQVNSLPNIGQSDDNLSAGIDAPEGRWDEGEREGERGRVRGSEREREFAE